VSYIVRCDAPACTNKATMWGGPGTLAAGWTQTTNVYGDVVHACPTGGHLAAAQATTTRVATATIV